MDVGKFYGEVIRLSDLATEGKEELMSVGALPPVFVPIMSYFFHECANALVFPVRTRMFLRMCCFVMNMSVSMTARVFRVCSGRTRCANR